MLKCNNNTIIQYNNTRIQEMQNFFIYLSSHSLGAARGPHHRNAPENFFIYLYVGPDIRVGNATMGGDCPGISLFISTVRSDGLRCRALRMRAIQNFFIYLSLGCMRARLVIRETFLTLIFFIFLNRHGKGRVVIQQQGGPDYGISLFI